MIKVQNVSKNFGSFAALKNVSFEIGRGEIVGFLGVNGAGKTTLMRILTTYLSPSSGKVSIRNLDVGEHSLVIRRNIGYLPENPPLYTQMNVGEYLKFAAQLKDVSRNQLKSRIDYCLQQCHLTDVVHKTIGLLSRGYKQRVGIAQAIIHDPQVLILDEPTNGLDPLQILQVRKLIKELQNKRTVILSTHILSEIEQIAHRVLVIKQGEIIVDDLIEDLLSSKENQKQKTLEEVFVELN